MILKHDRKKKSKNYRDTDPLKGKFTRHTVQYVPTIVLLYSRVECGNCF